MIPPQTRFRQGFRRIERNWGISIIQISYGAVLIDSQVICRADGFQTAELIPKEGEQERERINYDMNNKREEVTEVT